MADRTAGRRTAGVVNPDLICLSHLRWDLVFQRPHHLMTRFARDRRVFFVEEPIADADSPRMDIEARGAVTLAVPHIPRDADESSRVRMQQELLDELIAAAGITRFVLWYYTPMALAFSQHLRPDLVVFDCMDELSAFKGAPAALRDREAELLRRADLVLTGGQSLFEAKRHQHWNIHAMPSSVDVAHFATARRITDEPDDQRIVARPRLGFFGVIDERMDLDLLAGVADGRPNWQLVLLGPIVKIDPASLPRRPNIHYLGGKTYADLPRYIAGWDVALLPFARNDATRFISPTKTPEYLAAGLPVVSTSIRDVVTPYGEGGLARIADDPEAFIAACEAAMAEPAEERRRRADAFLRGTSWDRTWRRVAALCDAALDRRRTSDAETQGRPTASRVPAASPLQ